MPPTDFVFRTYLYEYNPVTSTGEYNIYNNNSIVRSTVYANSFKQHKWFLIYNVYCDCLCYTFRGIRGWRCDVSIWRSWESRMCVATWAFGDLGRSLVKLYRLLNVVRICKWSKTRSTKMYSTCACTRYKSWIRKKMIECLMKLQNPIRNIYSMRYDLLNATW